MIKLLLWSPILVASNVEPLGLTLNVFLTANGNSWGLLLCFDVLNVCLFRIGFSAYLETWDLRLLHRKYLLNDFQ